MLDFSIFQLLATNFMPHGTCYLWKPGLVGLHLGSNGIIALSYFSIPVTLVHLVRKRRDLPFDSLFVLFAAFIISCGIGHVMDIWTLWRPNYWIAGMVRLFTAIASLTTAIALVYFLPQILQLPSPTQLKREVEERKQAEFALKENQRRLEAIFNQTFQLMGLLNPDGTVLAMNKTALDFAGLSEQEVVNLPFWELSWWNSASHPHQPSQVKTAIDTVTSPQTLTRYEFDLSGDNHHHQAVFDFSFKPLLDESGEVELLIAEGRDITQRKQAEADLSRLNRELEERVKRRTQQLEDANDLKQTLLTRERIASTKIQIYEDIVLNIPIGLTIWHLEDEDDIDSFRLIDVNPTGMELLKINREQHIGQPMIDCFPNIYSNTHHGIVEIYAEVARQGKVKVVDNVIYEDDRIKDRRFAIKAFPLPNQCVGVAFEDITERRRMERALVDSTRRYRHVVNSINEVIFQLDESGYWTFLNPAWTTITGYGVMESLNRPFIDYITDETDQIRAKRLFESLIAGERDNLRLDLYLQKQDGNFCWLEMKAQLNQNQTQESSVGASGTLTDITGRKQAEKSLESRAKELTHLNALLFTATAQLEKRNQELEQFAYVTSHDLKAPLRAIANLSAWLEEDLEDKLDDETRHQMTLLRGRVQRMENLINGLLQYSRAGRLKSAPQPVDVATLLQEIIDAIAPPAEFIIAIEETMPELVTERLPLQQVFSNLISNAIKHHDRPDGKIEILAQEQENYYEFVVKDDGPGIPPQFHQRIFDIFQTLTPRDQKENTGIGLSIVKKIVENQGGTITLESQAGKGAIFRFTWRK